MAHELCNNCGEFVNLATHMCMPEWEIIVDGFHCDGEHGKAFGLTAGDAAIWFLERNWSDMEFTIEADVSIRKIGRQWRRFDISVEMVPAFYVNENYTNEKFLE